MTSTGTPASWALISLKELGDWSGGGTPSKAKPQYWQGGTIPWVSPKDMKTERISDSEDHITREAVSHSTASLINAGSVLIVTRSGILRHTLPVAVSSVVVTVNQDLKALTPRNGIIAEYVAWALRAFGRDILNTCSKQGTTVNSVETSKLLSFEIPVAPTEQQRSIVAEIEKQFSRLDEAVANLKRVKANLKRYKAAVLKAAVEGKLTEDWRKQYPDVEPASKLLERILSERRAKWNGRGKYKEPAVPDSSLVMALPDSWILATAEQFTSVITDGEHITPQRSASGVLLLSARNVLDGRLALADVDYVPRSEYDRIAKRLIINPGDVLLSCSGTVGRSTIAPENLLFTLVRSVAVLKPLAKMGKYLSIALRSPLLQEQVSEKKTQTAQANIFQGKIKTLVCPLPPLAEQERIVAEVERRLSVIEELEATVEANLTRADRLRQSILQRAFAGDLLLGGCASIQGKDCI
jgi:type I restriction enzyme S subunit